MSKVMIQNVRLAFPQLWEPKSVNGEGEPAYSASFIFPPEHPAKAAMEAAIDECGKEKWGAKWDKVKKELEAKDKTCLHDGDTKANYDGYEGNWYVSARNKSRPRATSVRHSPPAHRWTNSRIWHSIDARVGCSTARA